jgi:hypothetical protein
MVFSMRTGQVHDASGALHLGQIQSATKLDLLHAQELSGHGDETVGIMRR